MDGMSKSFFFYDLETSGLLPENPRIMQFAGQRTDENFRKIGDGVDVKIRLSEDVLPSPMAVLTTGITPQSTQVDGLTEADFLEFFSEEIDRPETIFLGYNTIRYDDEVMRRTLWRNFRDPYEWEWKNGNSRWDLLDVTRMIRALRPDGIKWPTSKKSGQMIANNRLENISALNNFAHEHAHDALSDVNDTIELAKLFREKQPEIFAKLLEIRDKTNVAKITNSGAPFIYSSGRLSQEFAKTSIFVSLGATENSGILVWDLRYDPNDFAKMSVDELKRNLDVSWEERQKKTFVKLPIKELKINKCPAVLPLEYLDETGEKNIYLTKDKAEQNFAKLKANRDLLYKIKDVFAKKSLRDRENFAKKNVDVEQKIYDGFFNEKDKSLIATVRNATAEDLADHHPDFIDDRLGELLLRYKARNFPKSLTADEKKQYEAWRSDYLNKIAPKYFRELTWLEAIAQDLVPNFAKDSREEKDFYRFKGWAGTREIDSFLLEELRLWAESIMPIDD